MVKSFIRSVYYCHAYGERIPVDKGCHAFCASTSQETIPSFIVLQLANHVPFAVLLKVTQIIIITVIIQPLLLKIATPVQSTYRHYLKWHNALFPYVPLTTNQYTWPF